MNNKQLRTENTKYAREGRKERLSNTQMNLNRTQDLKYLDILLHDNMVSEYNRFIYFSRVAKHLFKGTLESLAELSALAASIPILYDTRTGLKSGCVFYPSYSKQEPEYNRECCVYYNRGWKYCNHPALDCSGFVSWMLYILGIVNYPLNEYIEHKMRKNTSLGSGNWNIFSSNKCEVIDKPVVGCFILFQSHIAIVTKVVKEQVFEIVHSAKGGVKVNNASDIEWENYIESSALALGMQSEANINNRYLLVRVIL